MMVNKKEDDKVVRLYESRESFRIVRERAEERRQSKDDFNGSEKRKEQRRRADHASREQNLEMLRRENERLQMRNRDLSVSRPELVLYYVSLLLSVNVIFGWMAYLALFAQ